MFAVIGAVGFTLTFVLGVAEVVEIIPPAWLEAAQPLNFVGLVLGFLFVGVVCLRTDTQARTLGVLLLVPAIVFAVNIARDIC